jgi:hypothetical protein
MIRLAVFEKAAPDAIASVTARWPGELTRPKRF